MITINVKRYDPVKKESYIAIMKKVVKQFSLKHFSKNEERAENEH